MRMRGTIADVLKTGSPLHFPQSRLQLLAIFVACVLMTLVLVSLGYDLIPNPFSERQRWTCRIMSALFVPIPLYALYALINAGQKGLVLTRTGVADHRISAKEIPWSRIVNVREGAARSSRFIVLKLSNAGDAPRSLMQSLNSFVLGLASNERIISANGLEVSHPMLTDAIVAGWLAAKKPTVGRR